MPSTHPILIIGAGQAGLAMAFHLKRLGLPCAIIDGHARVGDAWRTRWDSLKLFSPAKYSALPEWPFAGDPWRFPDKDEVADRQENFARHHGFELFMRHRVEELRATTNGFALRVRDLGSDTVQEWQAKVVVVATGAFATPWRPTFAQDADPDTFQIHVATYQRPADLLDGPAVVVGTGASGTQVAAELSASRKVYLAGPETGHMPRRFLGKDFYWWLYTTGMARLRRDTWLGRRLLKDHEGADALIGASLKEIAERHGLIRRDMLTGFKDGKPTFDDGESADDIRSIVWATGYRNDYSWIKLPIFNENGQPIHHRGVVKDAPGLYFLGLKFLSKAHSANLGGVAEDAEYLAALMDLGGH